jgi:hypothetical protein
VADGVWAESSITLIAARTPNEARDRPGIIIGRLGISEFIL